MIQQIAFVLFILAGLGAGYLYADYLGKKEDKKIKEQMNEKELLNQIAKDLERDIKILNKKEVKQQNGRKQTNSRRSAETERAVSPNNENTADNGTGESSIKQFGGISLPKTSSNELANGNNATESRDIKWY